VKKGEKSLGGEGMDQGGSARGEEKKGKIQSDRRCRKRTNKHKNRKRVVPEGGRDLWHGKEKTFSLRKGKGRRREL